MFPYQDGKYFDLLYQAVQDCYPSVDKPSAKDILRELILSPKSDCIEINGTTYCKADIVQSLKRKLNNENEPKPFDERYHDLMDDALKTIKHMNDGYITEDDYTERNNFLSFINKKEFEVFSLLALLKLCPSLYDEKLISQLIYKVRSLRELNDLIRKYTKDEVSVNTDEKDYEQAKVVYRLLKSLQSLGYGYTISPKEKENLGICHDDDEDLSEDYAYDNWIKRLMLLQLRRETRQSVALNANYLNAMFSSNIGKTSTFFDDMGGRIAELRGALQKRRFDTNRFNMLEEKQEGGK